jgi:hypothetical protein
MTAAAIFLSGRARLLTAVIAALMCFAPIVFAGSPDVAICGEATEKLSEGDIADLRVLAAQILPERNVIAVIATSAPKNGEWAGLISRLDIYAAPVEQTARLWRGFYFGCVPEGKYHHREDGSASSGRWIADRDPLAEYAVAGLPNQPLPVFSPEALAQRNRFHITSKAKSADLLGIHDEIKAASPRIAKFLTKEGVVDIARLPIYSISFSGAEALVSLERGEYRGCDGFNAHIKNAGGRWQISSIGGFVY